ncbi:hypothetical protein ACFU44_06090 [Nocardia rhizosphaerihabitans]|uniref:hypothetical protein n=1 Tax=Nocardia rhizosphaerihabitans TaxID=1691570 RepID=UPI00367101CE
MSDFWEPVWMVDRTVVDRGRFYAVRGGWAEPAPRTCRNGHLLHGNMLVGVIPCGTVHGHHRTWWCRTCGHEIVWPPVDDTCGTQH